MSFCEGRPLKDAAALKDVERDYLGKKGAISAILAEIPKLDPTDRKAHGQKANALKQSILELVQARQTALDASKLDAARKADDFDPTLPAPIADRGSLHPITQVTRELEDLFISMGYEVLDGPEVELDHYNFEALNITKDHPARDSQDTFYCDEIGTLVLRTHTSPVQVRAMEGRTPPFRVIAPGRVFRQETPIIVKRLIKTRHNSRLAHGGRMRTLREYLADTIVPWIQK